MKNCLSCGRKISEVSIRCGTCNNKNKKGKKLNWKNKLIGINNHNWKGDKVSYRSLHEWIRRHKPKSMFCEKCGKVTEKLEVANISKLYKRDISDFRWLCRSCHSTEDKKVKNFKGIKEKKKGIMLICLNCNKEYYITNYRIKTSKFCCRNCKDKYRGKRR